MLSLILADTAGVGDAYGRVKGVAEGREGGGKRRERVYGRRREKGGKVGRREGRQGSRKRKEGMESEREKGKG